jgi:hypothetical protein
VAAFGLVDCLELEAWFAQLFLQLGQDLILLACWDGEENGNFDCLERAIVVGEQISARVSIGGEASTALLILMITYRNLGTGFLTAATQPGTFPRNTTRTAQYLQILVSTSISMEEENRSNLRSSRTQNLVPPRFREQSQHGREQQCAHEQDPDADAR